MTRITERMAAGIGAFERERYRDALPDPEDGGRRRAQLPLGPGAARPQPVPPGLLEGRPAQPRGVRRPDRLGGPAPGADGLPSGPRAAPSGWRRCSRELRQGSPDPEVLSEGRLVLAGTRADSGDLAGAVTLLVEAGAGRLVRNPAERHLRQWYVLGDLMERSGDLAKARELFLRIAAVDPDAYDVADRLESLGPPTRARRTPNRPRSAR